MSVTYNYLTHPPTHTHTTHTPHTHTHTQFVPEVNLGPASTINTTVEPTPTKHPPIRCSDNIISALILPDIVLLLAYFFGVYLFSKGETEYLSRLASHVSVCVCVCEWCEWVCVSVCVWGV